MVIDQDAYEKNKKKKIKIDTPTNHEGSSENVGVNLDEIYGISPSSSSPGIYYLITGEKDNLSCSCPARVECRHLKDIKNGNTACLRISRFVPEKV